MYQFNLLSSPSSPDWTRERWMTSLRSRVLNMSRVFFFFLFFLSAMCFRSGMFCRPAVAIDSTLKSADNNVARDQEEEKEPLLCVCVCGIVSRWRTLLGKKDPVERKKRTKKMSRFFLARRQILGAHKNFFFSFSVKCCAHRFYLLIISFFDTGQIK